jgi:hypothetical protein
MLYSDLMSKTTTHRNAVTPRQAEAVVAELQRCFNPVITDPQIKDLATYDGRFYPAPVVIEDWDGEGHTFVMWEEGPSDFAYNLDGSPSEEDHALFAQANAEFGANLRPPTRSAFQAPRGVEVDAYASYALILHRAS